MTRIINPATKDINDVILSNASSPVDPLSSASRRGDRDGKNLAFSCCYEILHGACPELNCETLRFTQGDRRRVQDDHYDCRGNRKVIQPVVYVCRPVGGLNISPDKILIPG